MKRTVQGPIESYLEAARIKSVQLESPLKNQLLILDLNGTLVSRVNRNKSMYLRPYGQEFFNYIFDNFKVMVWSSAQTHSVNNMSRMFGKNKEKILVLWDRTSFNLSTRDFNRKSLTIKDLDKVWSHFKGEYDATNTILLDDSPKKAQLQPYNCIHPTEFEHTSEDFAANGDAELINVMNYLKKLQFQSNVANYMKENPFHAEEKALNKTYLVEHYLFADEPTKKGLLVDLQPKKQTNKRDDSTLVEGLSNLKI